MKLRWQSLGCLIRQRLRQRKTSGYYAALFAMMIICIPLAALVFTGRGVIQASPALTRSAHLSPLFVVHEKDGSHRHTLLGDLAFGDSLGYMKCGGLRPGVRQEVVDGVLHVDGQHVVDVRRYGTNYIEAVCND